jgi:hypothetical protein
MHGLRHRPPLLPCCPRCCHRMRTSKRSENRLFPGMFSQVA